VGIQESGSPVLQDPALVPEDFDDDSEDHHGALALEFFRSTYEHYLDTGEEVFPDDLARLRERYGVHTCLRALPARLTARRSAEERDDPPRDRGEAAGDRGRDEGERRAAQDQGTLHVHPYMCPAHAVQADLAHWRTQAAEVERDYASWTQYVERLRGKVARTHEAVARETRAVEDVGAEARALQAELARHARTVAEQGLSPDEAARMTSEHADLGASARALERRLGETKTAAANLAFAETRLVRRAEEALDGYHDRAGALALGAGLALELDAVRAALRGPSVPREVQPALNRAVEQRTQARARVDGARIAAERALEALAAECEAEEERIAALRREAERLGAEAESIKEVRAHARGRAGAALTAPHRRRPSRPSRASARSSSCS
jgi:hypothetical protein